MKESIHVLLAMHVIHVGYYLCLTVEEMDAVRIEVIWAQNDQVHTTTGK